MKKLISWMLTLMLIAGICPTIAVNAEWDGTPATGLSGGGVSGNPYLIGTPAELLYASNLVNGGSTALHFKLTADIDYENNEWIPFAHSVSTNYSGTFDGDGYVVKNLKITDSSISQKGFFGQLSGSTIKNLGVENMTISISDTANGHRMGGFVCRASGTITNCYVKNSTVHHTGASGEEYGAAGFAGSTRTNTTISDCYVYGTDVKGCGKNISGFLGQAEKPNDTAVTGTTLTNCYVAATTVTNTAGNAKYAFGNKNSTETTFNYCYSTLTPSASTDAVTAASTKDEIKAALVTADADCAYAVNSGVNGGYPYLSTQKIEVTPDTTPAPTVAPTPMPYAGGTGTETDPYLIETATHLKNMSDAVNSDAEAAGASYKLIADIDFNGEEWTPAGRQLPSLDGSAVVYTPAFSGTFDGNNHIISDIKVTIADRLKTTEITNYTGFFGRCDGATVKNLGIDGMIISVYNHDYQYAEGKTIRSGNMGVMAGAANNSSFTNCYVANSSVRNMQRDCGDAAVGGFIGVVINNNTFDTCYAYNTAICAGQNAVQGGFFGYASGNGTVFNNCFAAKATHDIAGTSHATTRTTTYGFGCTSGKTVTATNCYSTLADSQGTHFCKNCISHTYTPAYSVGKTAMTAEALVNAVKKNGGFSVDNTTNGGYPYLAFGEFAPATEYAGGSGTEGDPFLIENASQLLLAQNDANTALGTDYHFKLLNDIDYGMREWIPIGHNTQNVDGTTTPAFIGGFDGNGHVIKNLKITNAKGGYHYREIGFFGYLHNATVKDLGIENIKIEVYNASNPTTGQRINYMGGFSGFIAGETSVKNCYVKNSSVIQMQRDASENGTVGGFTGGMSRYDTGGVSYYPTLENCYVYNTELCSGQMKPMGGFFGSISYGGNGITLRNCYAAGIKTDCISRTTHKTTTSTTYGFGNRNGQSVTIDNCYTTLAGSTGNHTCSNCVAPTYNSNNAVGNTVSESVLKASFENTDYITSADINDGYPHLSYQADESDDFIIESVQPGITAVSASYDSTTKTWTWETTNNNTVKVTVSQKSGETTPANVYVASYDVNGRLVGVDSESVGTEAFTADVDVKDTVTVKVFVWNENLSPVAKMYVAQPVGKVELNEQWTPSSGDTTAPQTKTRLVLMGDSIVDNVYHDSMGVDARYGWEGYIGNYLTDDIALVKHGHGSQTVKDFIVGRTTYHYCEWASIKKQFGEGDYVILALGHNDEKAMSNGLSADKNFTVDEFKTWYKEIIADVKAKGAKIILLTPTPENGSYESGQYYAPTYKSRTAILEVAAEADVPVIDMTQKFADKLNALMEKEGLTPADISTADPTVDGGLVFVDRLHLNEYGANLLAETVAEEIAKLTTGLEAYVK